MISGKTAIYGIFGHPVEHTFSPGMHNSAFRKLGLNACYVPFAVRPESLGDAARSIIPLGLRGLNITVPHKQNVIPYLDELTEDAKLIGAVNTIEVKGGRLIGHNTDGRGFIRSLRLETGISPKGKSVLILGAGGASRAVSFSLALAGARNIALYDVDRKKANALAKDIRSRAGAACSAVDRDSLSEAAYGAHIIVNATPLGLKKGDPLPLPREVINKTHLVCDLVYNPARTALLKTAATRGASTLQGIGMLLYQGVIAFEIWTGMKAPVGTMHAALKLQMAHRKNN
ncbi:MAG: shikimate dehydrogenase [Nitrospirota bacterium]|nr:shikimate dehydrogenase [Nitrospirota bacterium]